MTNGSSVAIVGIGGVFPQSPDLDAFWANIASGVSTARDVPAGRWLLDIEDAYDPTVGVPDKVYSPRACFIEDFSSDLGGAELDISPELLERLDPTFQLVLEAGCQAFQDAVTGALDRSRVGVILGSIALPTDASSAMAREYLGRTFEEAVIGYQLSVISEDTGEIEPLNRYVCGLPGGLLAKALGLGGGSYTLDAACASSLYALKLAVDELLAGRADAMLTGGVCRADSLYAQMGFSQLRALSPTGTCSPFDARGDGLVVGEGSGVVVLKRIEDALRDGDHIYGVIRGIGLSNDVGGSLLAPLSEGQLRAMRAAYEQAGWRPQDVGLIECHATGTPVGDAVEFDSLKDLWGDDGWAVGQCVIGSVKSNVGHLLTGAGAASLIKALLALKEKTLPPTANFTGPPPNLGMDRSPFKVLTHSVPWDKHDEVTPRRLAVSAFGFGGTNAHVLIEEWTQPKPNHRPPTPEPRPANPIAIVGMAAHFGPWRSLRAFQERVLGGDASAEPTANHRWWGTDESAWFRDKGFARCPFKGFYIDELCVSLERFRIPPKELEEMLPQQLLMLEVAADAIEDAGANKEDHLATGVFIGLGLDMGTTNFTLRWSLRNKAQPWARALGLELSEQELDEWVNALRDAAGPALTANRTMGALGSVAASRIAREFSCGGPSFTISSAESSGIRALEAAVRALQNGELERAIVGAVDMAGDVRAVLAAHAGRPFSSSGVCKPFDTSADGTIPGEGAAALVLKRVDDAIRDGDRVYAVIKGLGAATGGGVDALVPLVAAYEAALERAYADAEIAPESLGYIEAHGSGYGPEDRMEAEALGAFFAPQGAGVPGALGCVKADIGHAGAASSLAALVKACLCLYQEIVPPLRNCTDARPELTNGNPLFYMPKNPRYWLRNRADGPRRAGVSAFSVDGNCTHVVLEAFEGAGARSDPTDRLQPLGAREEALFAVEANNVAALSVRLSRLRAHVEHAPDAEVEDLARQWWKENREEPQRHRALAVVARSGTELLQQIEFAQQWLAEAPEKRLDGNEGAVRPSYARDRVFYSPDPLGGEGTVAFVFPGSGNHYPDMGRDLGVQWPEIFRNQDAHNEHLRAQYQPELFWDVASIGEIGENHRAVIFGQVALGTAVTDLIQNFGVRPDAVVGYSLGESAGLFALRAWTARDEMLRRMNASTLFTSDLVVPYDAVRKAWGLPASKTVDWVLGVIDRPAKVVRAALKDHKKVYRLIVNTLHECVIGGDRNAVERLVKKLECEFFPLQGVSSVHCEVAREVEKPYRELHLFETTPPRGVRFYSGASGWSYDVNRDTAADAILAQALHGIDFPKVINAAYEDGVRIFLEMGPGASCTRMIDDILEDRPHMAKAVCISGQSAVSTVLQVLGQLIAERVPVELGALYGQETRVVGHRIGTEAGPTHSLMVPVGGSPFVVPMPEHEPVPDEAPLWHPQKGLGASLEMFVDVTCHEPGMATASSLSPLVRQLGATQAAAAEAHETYLQCTGSIKSAMIDNLEFQMALIEAMAASGEEPGATAVVPKAELVRPAASEPVDFDRAMCMEFAVGKIGAVLGPEFAEVDMHPTRVRLPDEPLMLVDRIVSVHGEPRSMTSGSVVTEHDIVPGAWYLDSGRIPTCIAIEAGQADLFLSAYLGVDSRTRGLAMYRLLDAEVTFHRGLPGPGETIRYDIQITQFFRQGDTHFFRFQYDGTVHGEPLLTMRGGCAGFFTNEELEAGKGIVRSAVNQRRARDTLPEDWESFVPVAVESYSESQVDALRRGDLAGCFGSAFEGLSLKNPLRIPSGRMNLVHRVLHLDPKGGSFGLGMIRAEADIHPDDWFLICHFVDDRVMPGTLMYECCLQTLRVFLLRMGWVGEEDAVVCEPVPGVTSRLKCRGQVVESTKKVVYEVVIKELGYNPAPYALANAIMYSDDKPIVEITDLCVQFSGLTREGIRATWALVARAPRPQPSDETPAAKRTVFDHDSILAFATGGKPSEAFGERYAIFDEGRFIARLPRPPYLFLDRVRVIDAEPWKMTAGGVIEAQYAVPPDAWYFHSNRQETMPLAVLLEVAIQPCGWFAAYVGSALASEAALYFRNLHGTAVQHLPVTRDAGTLTTEVNVTNVSASAGMIIQNYDFVVRNSVGAQVYEGNTYFGFFSKEALADQGCIREAERYVLTETGIGRAKSFEYPAMAPFPDKQLRMLDRISLFVPDGGPHGLGFIRGLKRVNPDEWFFRAHFHQDPVWPGSLGLEAFLQLLKVAAAERWGAEPGAQIEAPALGKQHAWVYRGQVIPSDVLVIVEAAVTAVDDAQRLIQADGFLMVDGRVIYQMSNFAVRMR